MGSTRSAASSPASRAGPMRREHAPPIGWDNSVTNDDDWHRNPRRIDTSGRNFFYNYVKQRRYRDPVVCSVLGGLLGSWFCYRMHHHHDGAADVRQPEAERLLGPAAVSFKADAARRERRVRSHQRARRRWPRTDVLVLERVSQGDLRRGRPAHAGMPSDLR